MIDFLFTIDYEIYGNGTGALNELVYEPAQTLKAVFEKHAARFVNFVEVAEFEKIEAYGVDRASADVRRQIKEFYQDGFEIALHLHPQWANARYEDGRWSLDLSEYNLCTLPRTRIREIVGNSLSYLRDVVGQRDYTPLSFRAGNWLFQPTAEAAGVMAEHGIRIDSSVFKGGLQHNYQLDYRPASKNGYFWPFSSDVNKPDPAGPWLEVPIYSTPVPLWNMATTKRMGFKNQFGVASRSRKEKIGRALDFLRLFYPKKLDFCRMTLNEMTSTVEKVIREDRKDPEGYRPLVAIGHTKDLTDRSSFETVDNFLSFLKMKGIRVCTFPEIYSRLVRLASLETAAAAQSHA